MKKWIMYCGITLASLNAFAADDNYLQSLDLEGGDYSASGSTSSSGMVLNGWSFNQIENFVKEGMFVNADGKTYTKKNGTLISLPEVEEQEWTTPNGHSITYSLEANSLAINISNASYKVLYSKTSEGNIYFIEIYSNSPAADSQSYVVNLNEKRVLDVTHLPSALKLAKQFGVSPGEIPTDFPF